jgi:hypothetical protein
MKSVIKEEQLEELLLVNWTKFLDTAQIMAFVLSNVRSSINSFTHLEQTQFAKKAVQVTLSRFQPVKNGFILWAEFNIPINEQIAIGTTELHLTNTGTLSHIQSIGNLYQPN